MTPMVRYLSSPVSSGAAAASSGAASKDTVGPKKDSVDFECEEDKTGWKVCCFTEINKSF